MAIELVAGKTTYVCITVYLPVFVNTDEYEEDMLLCASFIDAIASHYLYNNDVVFLLCGDFNFVVNRLVTSKRLQIFRDLFSELAVMIWM
jgi:hypothetical protein